MYGDKRRIVRSRTVNLDKLLETRPSAIVLRPFERGVTLRAPLGTVVEGPQAPVEGHFNECRTARLFTLGPGRYRVGDHDFAVLPES